VRHEMRTNTFMKRADQIAAEHGMTTVQLLKEYTHETGIHRPAP